LFCKAVSPKAILLDPVVFKHKAPSPIAIFFVPVVLLFKALHPIATLEDGSLLKTKLSVILIRLSLTS
jgi:hypothetical protein